MSDTDDRRKAAQEALAGPERHKRMLDRETQLTERRKQAAAAMEGSQQRLRRITREKGEHEKEASEQERVHAQKRAEEMTRLRKAETERLKRAEEETKQKEDEMKLEEIRRSEETIAEIKKKPTTTSALRTFKGDMAHAIEKGASQASIALAEEERRRAMGASIPDKTPSSAPRIIMGTATVLLIVAGIGVLGYTFIVPYFTGPAEIISVAPVRSLIIAEETRSVDMSGMKSAQVLATLSTVIGENSSSTEMLHIYFTTKETGTSTPLRVTAPTWQRAVLPRMPVVLMRTLEPEFMYGVLRGTNPSGFIILSVDSPSTALSGMLAWEKTIASDLLPVITGSDNATLTGFTFQDRVLRNLDTRILLGENGDPLLLYSVLSGKKYIIITRDPSTFDELITRLATP